MLKEKLQRGSRLFNALKWAYQPIKGAKRDFEWWRAHALQQRVVPRYLARSGFHGLQIGCAAHRMAGWLNTDYLSEYPNDCQLDITEPLPFPDASLDAIYGEEVIEHVDFEGAKYFLSEARRVLRPGGTIRLTTPDATQLSRIYLGQAEHSAEEWAQFWLHTEEFTPELWLNSYFRFYGHQHVWSARQLHAELQRAGFEITRDCEPHVSHSGIEQLSGLEQRYGDAPDWIWLPTTIVEGQVEGQLEGRTKPH